MTPEEAEKAVSLIFEDLRDRRMLKWIFSERPTLIGSLNGEEFRSLDTYVLDEIKASWAAILTSVPQS